MFIAYKGGVRSGDDIVDGEVEITEAEYGIAIAAMLSGGKIDVVDDALTIIEASPDTETPPDPVRPPQPYLFATVGVVIENGAITVVEGATQFQGIYYEPGYLQVGFVNECDPTKYLVFVQSDVQSGMTQYKSSSGFELVFADTVGDPINPGRLDIQILEVR